MAHRNLDTNIGKDTLAMLKEVREFSVKTMRPTGRELDLHHNPEKITEQDSMLWNIIKTHRKLDLHLLEIPGSLDGMADDIDALTCLMMTELLGYADSGLAMSLEVSAMPFIFASKYNTPELKQIVKSFCNDADGKIIGGCAIKGLDQCETDTATSIKGREQNDTFIVNGEAAQVLNGTIATHGLFSIQIDSSDHKIRSGLMIIPLDLPGITKGKAMDGQGLRTLNQSALTFRNVDVPKHCLITDDPDEIHKLQTAFTTKINDIKGIIYAGLAMAAYDEAFAYSHDRIQGTKPIFEHRNIKLQLFKMFKMVEAARANARRSFVYNKEHADEPSIAHAVAAKCLSTETAVYVIDEAIQIYGGNGLAREYPLDKMFRDARAGMIDGGANDFQGVSVVKYL